MPSKDPTPLLDRLCEQYTAYRETHPAMQLYALIDPSALSPQMQSHLHDVVRGLPRFALYQDTGLDDLAAHGPFLIICPSPDNGAAKDIHQSLVSAAKTDYRCISWLWCEHDALALVAHLQTLLHAQLEPDGRDVWFHFYQASYLSVLHRELPEDARRYMFGALSAWWCLDLQEEWVELVGENQIIPQAWDAFPMRGAMSAALQEASAAAQVSAWLGRIRPDLSSESGDANDDLRRLTSIVSKARRYGIHSKQDTGIYALNALRHGADYDAHPALKALLDGYASLHAPLIDAYQTLGGDVWREIASAAAVRHAAAGVVKYQSTLRERGFVRMPVKVVNDTAHDRSDVELIPPIDADIPSACLGSTKARDYGPGVSEIDSAVVPIPGTKVRVSSTSLSGRPVALETLVAGDLPAAEGEGMAVVAFDRDGFPTVTVHAQTPSLKSTSW